MTAHTYTGECHCGNITLAMDITGDPASYTPRACDCDFCMKAGAKYLSDPNGRLTVTVKDAALLNRYRHGSRSAEFYICGNCGVLAAVGYEEQGRRYATVNVNALDDSSGFGAAQPVSPKTLSADDKIKRWKKIWFADVSLVT